mgnify:CR=1 FL=1
MLDAIAASDVDFVVHVGDEGEVLLPHTQVKQVLDRLKKAAIGRDLPDAKACARFDKATKDGQDMRHPQKLLAAAVSSVVGKSEERAVASLFTPGGTHALTGEFAGIDDTFVVANGDVLTDLDVSLLVDFHRQQGAEATIHLIGVPDPSAFGVVALDDAGRVERFVEKPAPGTAPSNLIDRKSVV